ncbi:MAG: FtsW/RodA/SpoVE family cell cycle protein, partial [Calditrichaeota bacterium]|nr:FtsW/RodA/SpoVE family cell cycle protein [Calditrichota bacterium]
MQSLFTDHPVQAMAVNYQAKQSLISFGVGGFTGVGLGQSKQKFFFLPEAHTDYILAIIGEEMGFIGAVTVITLFFIVIWRGIKIANQSKHLFHYYLASGLTFYLGSYAFINAMIVLNLLPSTGLPMPFVSYGGTQLLVSMMCIGLLLNISAQNNKDVIVAEQEDYLGPYEQAAYE